tara:strand:- start:607 stop:1686 length:1080 start_codon:yes stop_codon:yes gene_type:complete
MSGIYLSKGLFPEEFFRPTIEFILSEQQYDGSIPWFDRGYADPWDHIEAAMALSIGGELIAAEKAYLWLQKIQLEDGSWWASYRNGEIDNHERRESNFIAYIATGVWHHYLISENDFFLSSMWPTVERAIEFVLSLQSADGEISWAVRRDGSVMEDALVTGCSSIYKSLECAINIATTLRQDTAPWLLARKFLGEAIRNKPERFDRTWKSKERYSMDWFYPVLSGVLSQQQSQQKLKQRWSEFVEEGMGCRCVSDQPWITIAESCELVMALLAAGDHAKAIELYSWVHQWRLEDGSYWTGYQFAEALIWPDEKPTWTAAAVLLAADALTLHTAAAKLFQEVNLLTDEPLEDKVANKLRS